MLLREGLHRLLTTSRSLTVAAFNLEAAAVVGQPSCACLSSHPQPQILHHDGASSSPAAASLRFPAPSAWGACRSFASDSREAALQRLSRASRHRAQTVKAAAAKAGKVTQTEPLGTEAATDAVVVTPSETNASEQQLASVISHPALIITRPVEWGTVIFGYEQANRYQVFDQDGTLVAQIAEDYTGLGNEVGRQLLRTRRSFSATVFSADGSQVIFRVQRPAYLITSTMFIEDAEGAKIGEVHRRFSLLQRNYDLYLNKKQFAAIAGNFLAWEFELKDSDGGTLAFIDRNFQGFGKEIFTDAGKYVIHFGMPSTQAAEVASRAVQAKEKSTPPVTPLALVRTDVAVIPTASGNQLVVARPLELTERMITLACAISIDYDFFSQHSHGGGLVGGMMPMPIPIPMPGGGAAPVGEGDVAGAGGAAGAAGAAGEPSLGGSSPDVGGSAQGTEQSFGGEEWPGEQKFGEDEQEITWDNGGGESQEDAGGVVGTIWGWVTGGD